MRAWLPLLLAGLCLGCASPLTINQIQFVGSHNSYKQAMSPSQMQALRVRNPQAADALDYAHLPLSEQLSAGIRKIELDVFFDPESGRFPVGHVQMIDMNSHCVDLQDCLQQVRQWSQTHPDHVPLWISFNAKDQKIEGLPDPARFDAVAFQLMDAMLEEQLGDRLIRPSDMVGLVWPRLADTRGKVLLILDEQGDKRDLYWQDWRSRPMFTNAPEGHPAAAIMIINDPIAEGAEINRLVKAGYMVRTRADADTREARSGSTARRDAAFASGAQAVSTDYYVPDSRFNTGYEVKLPASVRCNPVTAPKGCTVAE